MKKTSLRLIGAPLVSVVAFMIVCGFLAQELPSCRNENVTYSSFDEHYAPNIAVQPGPMDVLAKGEKQFSPQKTRWMTVTQPDYTKPGPWSTRVSIRKANKDMPEILTFRDHASGGVQIRWLNEKLLYGSVWWGRIVSTDFVFDAEKKTFIYREMANYGEVVRRCQ